MSDKEKHSKSEISADPKRRGRPGKPYPEITLHIDDTPENVAKALFNLNPNEPGFEWKYMQARNK